MILYKIASLIAFFAAFFFSLLEKDAGKASFYLQLALFMFLLDWRSDMKDKQ